MKPWLTKEEAKELTARVRPSAQLRQLESLGFYHLVHFRTDGSFVGDARWNDQHYSKERLPGSLSWTSPSSGKSAPRVVDEVG